jgi:Cu(I)/Ag(I) efflux system protein CusF
MTPTAFDTSWQRVAVGLTAAALFTASLLAQAQTPAAPAGAAPATTSTAAAPPKVEAEVRRIDARAGKITLKHGNIPNLDMPPMTMVFQVRDPAQLGALKPGDKIRFVAEKINGAYTASDFEPIP